MAELIAFIIFLICGGGIILILGKKIPALLAISQPNISNTNSEKFWIKFLKNIETGMQKLPFLKNFSWELWIEKKIAKARILALKVDNFLSGYSAALHAKKEKNQNNAGQSEYWTDIKDFVKTKTGLRIHPIKSNIEVSLKTEEKNQASQANKQTLESQSFTSDNMTIKIKQVSPKNKQKKSRKQTAKKSQIW